MSGGESVARFEERTQKVATWAAPRSSGPSCCFLTVENVSVVIEKLPRTNRVKSFSIMKDEKSNN